MTAATTSPSTQRAYGIERVCAVWGFSRSTLYAERARQARPAVALLKRGPRPKVGDLELLGHIRKDLETSPFKGEGHRKVWARLRVLSGIRVSRMRVLGLMRQHKLLSPHRGRQGTPLLHDGVITTKEPNLMWGTDGARILTVEEGWVWLFTAVEHWNAECVGWHVCKLGDRYAALQPVAMGLKALYGALAPDVARGLKLRMDHGTQYLSDHFLNQVRYWGIAPSFAFVQEPQTNGVVERFNRTIKEQVIHGRVFRNSEEVRQAVGAFVARYNAEWLVEKLGYKSPSAAREAYRLKATG